ncbi:MAG: PQQ-binding-like beta-propeller repeat protein [Deltaproteobacteria bacterium]|nr:PQQ-binding-like beta-propeller repeat protein [Deltaproteobacteria bacterium]
MAKTQGTWALGTVLPVALALSGCASTPGAAAATLPNPLPNEPVARAPSPLNACPTWKLPLHAHLSHISVSDDAGRILVSTSAEKGREARLRLLSRSGKVLWMRDLKQPVKSQALSGDGRLAVVNTYDGKLTAIDTRAGKPLWEREHLGRPMIFTKQGRVILLNDDDSEPKTAFVSYDLRGKLVATVTAEHESLDMDAPADESYVAVSTTDRMLLTYSPDGKPLWRGKLDGDPISVEAAGGAAPRVYVLATRDKTLQSLSAFEHKGMELSRLWTVALDRKYEAVRASGDAVFLYGNSHLGQALAAFSAMTGAELWRRSYADPASYSSLVFPALETPYMTVALDEGKPAGTLHVMGVDRTGAARWDAPLAASSGLYSYGFAEKAPALVVGAGEPGDGLVQFIRLTAKACKP